MISYSEVLDLLKKNILAETALLVVGLGGFIMSIQTKNYFTLLLSVLFLFFGWLVQLVNHITVNLKDDWRYGVQVFIIHIAALIVCACVLYACWSNFAF